MTTTTERGYGADHQALRKQWAPLVDAGEVDCSNPHCTAPQRRILPGEKWHLGHLPDRSGYRGPEHAACNTGEGARFGAAVTNAARGVEDRDWGQP